MQTFRFAVIHGKAKALHYTCGSAISLQSA